MNNDTKIKIILLDDHLIFRDGLKSLLAQDDQFAIIGEASDAEQLFKLLERVIPDILIADISLPDESGIEVTRRIQSHYQCISVLILSMHSSQEYVLSALDAGAKGYLPKDCSASELKEAIQTLSKGETYFSPTVSGTILKHLSRTNLKGAENIKLTSRETEILRLAANGKSNKEIASDLFISPRTVDCHKNHIMQKLSLKNTAELILYAVRHGLVNP